MNTATPELPAITDEDQQFLHYNPNTSDLVEWVRDYARRAIAADRAANSLAAPEERAAFEAWTNRDFARLAIYSDLRRDEDGKYRDHTREAHWVVWQARASLHPVETGSTLSEPKERQ